MDEHFDVIVVGGGSAGPSLAGRFADNGLKIALLERDRFGGTCVNTGCIPTKTLVASAYVAHAIRRGGDYGVVTGPVSVDMEAVAARAKKVSGDVRNGLDTWLAGIDNISVIHGHGRLAGPGEVRVGDRILRAPRIFLNVGARAALPDIAGIDDTPFLTNSQMVSVDFLPQHLVIVGGGAIGLEYAQMYRRFGAEVTLIERSERIASREDADISDQIRAVLEQEGVTVRTGAECLRVARDDDSNGIVVHVQCDSGEPEVRGSHLLLAVGRRPNTDDLGLETCGVEVDAHGFIVVDDELRTTGEEIWAMGDCNGRGTFTHTAFNDYEIVAANLLDGEKRRLSDRIRAYAIYVDPPLGRVGMTEAEARATGRAIAVARRPMTMVERAVEKGETAGEMKIIADLATREILGAAILGVGGDEAIHGIIDTMYAGGTIDTLRWSVPIHPTVSELIPTLLQGLEPVT